MLRLLEIFKKEVIKLQGVVIFSFGFPKYIESNFILKKIAWQYLEEENLILTQLHVFDDNDVREKFPEKSNEYINAINYIQESLAFPSSTFHISKTAMIWSQKKQIDKLIVVAANPHMKRCLRDLNRIKEKMGIAIEIKPYFNWEKNSKKNWFSQYSDQIRTKSKLIWTIREFILKTLPFWLYAKITF